MKKLSDNDIQRFKIEVDKLFEKVNAKNADELYQVNEQLMSIVDDCFGDFITIRNWEW